VSSEARSRLGCVRGGRCAVVGLASRTIARLPCARAVSAADATPRLRSGGEAAEGLVPFKTSLPGLVQLDQRSVADRRVRRLKRSVWASGHLHGIADRGHRAPVCWFVTLTYRGVDDWRADHISAAVQRFRNWARKLGVPCRYTWVAELQMRGAVHYHLLAWLPVGVRMPHWDRVVGRRAAFWPHGMTNTEVAVSGVGYLMKYLSKLGELTKFPKGLRLYGIGGLDESARKVRQWFNLPTWARSAYGVGELVRKAAVGLVVRATGEILPPVFKVSRMPGALILQKLREVPGRFPELAALGAYPGAFSSFPRVS
jgi:hypothetical protein